MSSRAVLAVALGLLAGCATIRGDLTQPPPLPFASVAAIPWEGAAVQPYVCAGQAGVMVLTGDGAYQVFLVGDRAVIVDNRPGDELPVWFARITPERTFALDFVLSYREATARYPGPCAYLGPRPAPANGRPLIILAASHVDLSDPVIQELVKSGRLNPRGYDDDKLPALFEFLPPPPDLPAEEWWWRMSLELCRHEPGYDARMCQGDRSGW